MKIALVTGAYKGLGLEWCKQLVEEGYTIILTARNLENAQEAANLISKESNTIFPHALDVTNQSQLINLVNWTRETFGKIDLIINNAGINPKDYKDKEKMAKAFTLSQFDMDEMLEVIKINSLSPLLVVKNFKELLIKSEKPIVINISSWLASVTNLNFGGHYGYIGSKNLLNILNKSMALEIKSEGIICVNVNPGWVQTDMGGSKARFSTKESVQNIILNILNKITIEDTGKFFNFDGNEHPW